MMTALARVVSLNFQPSALKLKHNTASWFFDPIRRLSKALASKKVNQ
jgi:hypothetical protein